MTSKIGFLFVVYMLLAIFLTGVVMGLFGESSGAGDNRRRSIPLLPPNTL